MKSVKKSAKARHSNARVRIPAWWIDCEGIGPAELAVLVVLADHAGTDGVCHPSQSTIARRLGKSRSWVNETIARLLSTPILKRDRQWMDKGGETSCRYHLVSERPVSDGGQSDDESATAGGSDGHPGGTPCRAAGTACRSANTVNPCASSTHPKPTHTTLPLTAPPDQAPELAAGSGESGRVRSGRQENRAIADQVQSRGDHFGRTHRSREPSLAERNAAIFEATRQRRAERCLQAGIPVPQGGDRVEGAQHGESWR